MPIQVHILAGKQAGRRVVLRTSPVSIGRDPSCDIVIDEPTVSRRQLRLETHDGQWWVFNESDQGTSVGWRRLTTQPRQVKNTMKLSAASQPLVELTPIADDAAVAESETLSDSDAGQAIVAGKKASGRSTLWIGIGVFWLVVISVGVFLSFVGGGSEESDDAPELTDQQILAEIYQPPMELGADDRQATVFLTEANHTFALRDSSSEAIYRSYAAYTKALSYTPDQMFKDGADERRYQIIRKMLADQLVERYRNAMNAYLRGDFATATQRLRDLVDFYPAGQESKISQNIEEHLSIARKHNAR